MNIFINSNLSVPSSCELEVVERKGVGHPDTLADSIAEKISVDYSQYCLKKFGVVLHHNVDKVCIMGGLIKIYDWGLAKMVKPIRVLVNGRISPAFNNEKIPLSDIFEKAINLQLKKTLPHLDVKNWMQIIDESTSYSKNPRWFNPVSLNDLPEYKIARANDTSCVVGFWPLTPIEELTLKMENFFYLGDRDPKYKFIGHDIKVMIVRKNKKIDVTLCVPFIVKETPSYNFYKEKVDFITESLLNVAKKHLGNSYDIRIYVNNHYRSIKKENIKKIDGYYCNVSGSALDYGEEGVVGRGNNRRGIIPSFRPYTMEAVWGKNPVYHVGKVLGLVVDTLAKNIALRYNCHAEVIAITRVADPLFEPHNLLVRTSKKINSRLLKELILETLKKRDWTEKIIFNETFVPKTNYEY
jgi:S-adenosylmethionine synthetase